MRLRSCVVMIAIVGIGIGLGAEGKARADWCDWCNQKLKEATDYANEKLVQPAVKAIDQNVVQPLRQSAQRFWERGKEEIAKGIDISEACSKVASLVPGAGWFVKALSSDVGMASCVDKF